MKRRKVIKGIVAVGAVAALPQFISANSNTHLPFHFIGLGGAGCNGLAAIHAKNNAGHFTCITDVSRPYLPPTINFIPFLSPVAARTSATDYLVNDHFAVQPTDEMQTLLSQQHHYVLLAGLGGYTGTRLLQAFADYLRKEKRPFTIIASLPFTWETGRRKGVEQLLPDFRALPQFYSFDFAQLSNEGENKKMNLKLFMQMANEKFYDVFLQHHPV